MKKITFFKSLLVAAMICVGGSAWAQTPAFSQDFTAIGDPASTDPSDYGFTTSTSTDCTATVGEGILTLFVAKNASSDVNSTATAEFSAIGTGNVITFSCSWNPGGPTGTRPYAHLKLTDAEGNAAFTLTNNGQAKTLFLNGDEATSIASGNDWRSGSVVWNVVATLNVSTQKITSLTVTKSGESTPVVSLENQAFQNSVTSISKFICQTTKKSNYEVTTTLDNVSITYEAAAATAAVTYKYVDTDDNDLSALKADVVQQETVGATVSDLITSDLSASFKNGDESIRYDYSTLSCSDATVPAGGTTVYLKFTPNAKFTYNVYAVDDSDTQLATIATASAYAGETASLVWSKYVKVSDQWYVTATSEFTSSATAAGSKNVLYEESDIAYFFEMENLTRTGGAYLTEANGSYSNNYRLRISKGSTHYTPALAAGVYTLTIPVNNSNSSSSEVYVYTRSSEGELSEKLHTHTAEKGNTTLSCIVSVPEGYSIAFKGNEGSNNNNGRMDYMTLKKTTVPVTIASSGYSTIASAYALDCANLPSGLTAYQVTATSASSVTLTEVTEAVAAGTGLILAGTASTAYDIPVVASGSNISSTNKLKAAVTATTLDDGTFYVLKGGKFCKVEGAADEAARTVPAGKAYLLASDIPAPARELSFVFDDTTTSINEELSVKNEESATAIYNLSGQRVAQPQKGLYIMNGKKVIVK